MRRQSLLLLDEREDEGSQGHSVLSALLHRRGGDDERVVLDPLFPDRSGFTGAQHGCELKEEEDLRPPRRLRHDAHDGGKLLPVDGRHRLHDGRGEDAAHPLDRIVLDETCAHRQVEDLTGAHQDPLERGSLARLVESLDGVDHEGCGDLVELARSDRPNEIALEAALFILIAHDASALETAPQLEGIAERVTRRRSLTDLLFLSSRELSGLRERQGGEVPEKEVSDFPVLANSQDETLRPCWLNLDGETSAEGDCESLFLRFQCRDFLGGKHGVEEIPRYR